MEYKKSNLQYNIILLSNLNTSIQVIIIIGASVSNSAQQNEGRGDVFSRQNEKAKAM